MSEREDVITAREAIENYLDLCDFMKERVEKHFERITAPMRVLLEEIDDLTSQNLLLRTRLDKAAEPKPFVLGVFPADDGLDHGEGDWGC